jgi:hypothetical protein
MSHKLRLPMHARTHLQGGADPIPGLASFTGVTSLAKSGDTQLTGDVTLSEGSGVTLTEVGQNIEIAASGSAFTPTSVFIAVCSSVNMNGTGTRVLAPWDGTKTGTTGLIDTTTATAPTIVAAGTYAISVWADCISTSSGSTGDFVAELTIASTHGTLLLYGTTRAATTVFNPSVSLSVIASVGAGAAFALNVGSKTSSTEQAEIENALIVRIA